VLIEFVVRRWLGLGVESVLPGIRHLPQRRAPAGATGGAEVGSPRHATISLTAIASLMKPMISISVPHRGE
jgi:hypothetical protein